MEIGLLSLDKIYWIRVEFGLETAACTQRRASSSDPTGFSFFFCITVCQRDQCLNSAQGLRILHITRSNKFVLSGLSSVRAIFTLVSVYKLKLV